MAQPESAIPINPNWPYLGNLNGDLKTFYRLVDTYKSEPVKLEKEFSWMFYGEPLEKYISKINGIYYVTCAVCLTTSIEKTDSSVLATFQQYRKEETFRHIILNTFYITCPVEKLPELSILDGIHCLYKQVQIWKVIELDEVIPLDDAIEEEDSS